MRSRWLPHLGCSPAAAHKRAYADDECNISHSVRNRRVVLSRSPYEPVDAEHSRAAAAVDAGPASVQPSVAVHVQLATRNAPSQVSYGPSGVHAATGRFRRALGARTHAAAAKPSCVGTGRAGVRAACCACAYVLASRTKGPQIALAQAHVAACTTQLTRLGSCRAHRREAAARLGLFSRLGLPTRRPSRARRVGAMAPSAGAVAALAVLALPAVASLQCAYAATSSRARRLPRRASRALVPAARALAPRGHRALGPLAVPTSEGGPRCVLTPRLADNYTAGGQDWNKTSGWGTCGTGQNQSPINIADSTTVYSVRGSAGLHAFRRL